MSKSRNHQSRRKTPWSGKGTMTPTQKFLSERYKAQYEERHPALTSTGESDLINSVIPETCPYCNEADFSRFGRIGNGVQRYRCKSCGQTFTPHYWYDIRRAQNIYQRMDGTLPEYLPLRQYQCRLLEQQKRAHNVPLWETAQSWKVSLWKESHACSRGKD